ncbi:MAG TPA: DUF302 domain-containing protein [Magnetospirillaceae bacterium]|jgi:uncharacterized protein (DUF302 family)
MTENGLITVASAHDVATTIERLISTLESKRVAVFARIDHAAEVGPFERPLRPTTTVLFGNPAAGMPLMRIAQTTALDLPLRMLIWEDAKGTIQLSYSDPSWVAKRHHVGSQGLQSIRALSAAMSSLAKQVTAANPKPVVLPDALVPKVNEAWVADVVREPVPAQ